MINLTYFKREGALKAIFFIRKIQINACPTSLKQVHFHKVKTVVTLHKCFCGHLGWFYVKATYHYMVVTFTLCFGR